MNYGAHFLVAHNLRSRSEFDLIEEPGNFSCEGVRAKVYTNLAIIITMVNHFCTVTNMHWHQVSPCRYIYDYLSVLWSQSLVACYAALASNFNKGKGTRSCVLSCSS